jgi:pimeloyl-ACP methyl ester carboxylesterase
MSSIVTRIVFVHGSVGNAQSTWTEQRALAGRFECVFVTRSGYPPGPPLERIDFEEQADDVAGALRDGDHLVGHSYGGVVSLLAAARGPKLASLTVSEPPASASPSVIPLLRSSSPGSRSTCRRPAE